LDYWWLWNWQTLR